MSRRWGGGWLRGGHIPSAGLPLVDGLLSYHGLPSFCQTKPSAAAIGSYMLLQRQEGSRQWQPWLQKRAGSTHRLQILE